MSAFAAIKEPSPRNTYPVGETVDPAGTTCIGEPGCDHIFMINASVMQVKTATLNRMTLRLR